jgi:integrase
MNRPAKPHPDFPLQPNLNGQWSKKINQKPYYFGSWKDDPKGERAIREYNDRLPGILSGTDHLRALAAKGLPTVGGIMSKYLGQCKLDVLSGGLSKATYGERIRELELFANWIHAETAVANLKPEHFAGYVQQLIEGRKLKARARKRVQAHVKTMFRWGAGNGHCPLPNFGSAMKAPSTTKQAIRKEKARAGIKDHSDRILTGAEIDKLLAASQPNMAAMILLGVNCGLGPADLGRMTWRHLDSQWLNYPRHKTGNDRKGYLWKRTRDALERVRETKHAKLAIAKDGEDALVFITRKGLPYYREELIQEDGKAVGVQIHNAVSITFGRTAKGPGMEGVTFYRLRHTFKTLGKRAKDIDALNLCMGHRGESTEATYDHESIRPARIKRVALKVKHRLWPRPKRQEGIDGQTMRLVSDGPGEGRQRKVG